MVDLIDRVAFITGAGRGIGRAIALAFARAGCHVAAVARTETEIAETAALVREQGRQAVAIRADVAVAEDVNRAVAEATEQLGPIDILVNNAGYLVIKPIVETTLEEFDRTLAVNLRGLFLCVQAVLPGMIARRRGTIINLGSTSSKRWYRGQDPYCAAKHGVLGFTKVLAEECDALISAHE